MRIPHADMFEPAAISHMQAARTLEGSVLQLKSICRRMWIARVALLQGKTRKYPRCMWSSATSSFRTGIPALCQLPLQAQN